MISRNSLLAGSALAAMLAAHSARADLIQWTVSGDFKSDDGGTFSGTFTYDNVADTVTAWDITTSSGTLGVGPNTYMSSTPFGGASSTGSEVTFGNEAVIGPFSYLAYVDFDGLNPGTPGTVDPLTGEESYQDCFIGCIQGTRDIASGTAVGMDISAPEPASGALMLAGIGLLGVYRRQRQRGL